MTTEFYGLDNYSTDCSTYGGKIYDGDYDNYHSMSDIAQRIASDFRFDEKCRKNTIARDENMEENKNLWNS